MLLRIGLKLSFLIKTRSGDPGAPLSSAAIGLVAGGFS